MGHKNKILLFILLVAFCCSQALYPVQRACSCYEQARLSRSWFNLEEKDYLYRGGISAKSEAFIPSSLNTEYRELFSQHKQLLNNLREKYGFRENIGRGRYYSDFEHAYQYLEELSSLLKEWRIVERTFIFDRNINCFGMFCDYSIGTPSQARYREDIDSIVDNYRRMIQWIKTKHDESDLLFQEIMEKCMAMHFNARTFHDYGLYQFKRGNYDSAFRTSKALLDHADKNDKEALKADTYFLQGLSYSLGQEYSKAIEALTQAIERDPQNSDAYVERAIAYFELGKYDLALSDFLASAKKLKNGLSEDPYHIHFSLGFGKGSAIGLVDGAKDMPASLMHSMHGIGRLLWAGVTQPVDSYHALAASVDASITDLRTQNASELAKKMVPELRELIEKWDVLEPTERGEKAGYVLGKYGIEVVIPGTAVKALKKYHDLRRANALCTLETMSVSTENRVILEKFAHEASQQRAQFFKNAKIHADKQGKHIEGHRNYQPKVDSDLQPSILKHPDPEKLLHEHAGTGSPTAVFKHGQRYQEYVDFKEYIGECYDRKTNQFLPTTRGKIHYDKNGGAHIVPAHPEAS